MKMPKKIASYCLCTGLLASGCGALSDGPAKKAPANLIATPASYYSTAKARYLGSKYKHNLDRLTERIVRNPNTMQLQFANNISSVGGIGFFTHSATKTADERYLEVVLATPETFESKGDYSEKVNRLFSRYGQDLLSILLGDSEIFQEKELAGYGLNLHWRTVVADGTANRVSLARAVVYFHKERAAGFLRRSISQNELLRDAVIFAVEDDGPLQLVSYQPRESKPDSRPAIREDDLLADSSVKPAASASANDLAKRSVGKPAAEAEPGKKEEPLTVTASTRETSSGPSGGRPSLPEAAQTPREMKSAPAASTKSAAPQPVSEPESLALSLPPVEAHSVKPVPETFLQKAAPQKIATPPAEKERATAQETTSSRGKIEPTTLSTDSAKGQSSVAPVAKARQTKSDPISFHDSPETKTPAATVAVTKAPQNSERESTRQPDEAMTRQSAEPSMPKSERSAPDVTSAPETIKLAPGPQAPKNPATAAEAVVKSPVVEMRPATSAEGVARQTAPGAKIPPAQRSTPAPELATKRPAAETKPSSPPARADAAIVPPAKIPDPGPTASSAAKEVTKIIADESKTSTSPARVEASSPPSTKFPEVPTVEKLAKSSVIETKQSSSPARIEAPAPPAARSAVESAGAAASKAFAKSSVVEAKPAASSSPTEIPTVPSGHIPAQSLAPGDSFRAPLDTARMDQKQHIGGLPAIKKADEPAMAAPAPQVSQATRLVPGPATASPPKARTETKPKEQVSVEASSKNPTQTADPINPREGDSAPPAINQGSDPSTRTETASKLGPTERVSPPAAGGEQLALLRKPVEPPVQRAPAARPAPRPLQGFIIQVAFQDKQKAQSWAEKMTQRGYAVSLTEAGPEGSLRVRLGNFAVRDEAERQLQNFKQEGMSGIIINLPQAFRPEAVSSIP